MALLSQMKKEILLKFLDSSVERTGDDNIAIALTRLTGLSLVRGKYVYVRGLGERYSAATLNGSGLPKIRRNL